MRKVGYWPVRTPWIGPDISGWNSILEDQDNAGRRLIGFLPFLLAVGVSVVMVVAWWSFAAINLGRESEMVDHSSSLEFGDIAGTVSDSVALKSSSGSGSYSEVNLSGLFTPEVLFWQDKILEWSRNYSIDPNIVATIMQIESCGHPGAVSFAGARGLFQVMPFHFEASENMLDPDTNARRGLLFFREQMRYTGNDILLSFAGYNGGYAASGGRYQEWPNETQRYYYWAQGIFLDAGSGRESSPRLDEWLSAGGASGCRLAAQSLGL